MQGMSALQYQLEDGLTYFSTDYQVNESQVDES